MKFTRTLKPLKGQFELAPYLCVVFVLLFFMLFGGYLVLPVGTRLELPPGGSRSGTWTGDAFLVVAVDAGGAQAFERGFVLGIGLQINMTPAAAPLERLRIFAIKSVLVFTMQGFGDRPAGDQIID